MYLVVQGQDPLSKGKEKRKKKEERRKLVVVTRFGNKCRSEGSPSYPVRPFN